MKKKEEKKVRIRNVNEIIGDFIINNHPNANSMITHFLEQEAAQLSTAETAELVHLDPAQGPLEGGTRVLIYGVNFVDSGPLCVMFGTRVAPFVRFISDSQLLAVSPPGASPGPVPVRVSLNGTNWSKVSVYFTYLNRSSAFGKLNIIVPADYGTPDTVDSSRLYNFLVK